MNSVLMTRGHQYKVASDMLKESFMGLKLPSLHLTGTDSQVEGNSHGVYVCCNWSSTSYWVWML